MPHDRTKVMLAVGVVIRRKAVERLDGVYQSQHIGECPYPRRYHNVPAAFAELVVQPSNRVGLGRLFSRHLTLANNPRRLAASLSARPARRHVPSLLAGRSGTVRS